MIKYTNHLKYLIFSITMFALVLVIPGGNALGQFQNKKGGLAFRIDNNPALNRLNSLDSLFSKYGYPFGVAVTSWTLPITPSYVSELKTLQQHGHEIMDNTPTHQTNYFKVLTPEEAAIYEGHPGVDHISGTQVSLRYTTIDTSQAHNEWKINLFGNKVISYNPGEFADLLSPDFFAVYLSSPVNKLCIFYDVQAYNVTDPDTLYVKDFWDEPLDLGNHWYFDYHKLTHRNVILHPSAIQLLGERSQQIFNDLGLDQPATWIHPSGPFPYISGYELNSYMGDSLGFNQGSNFVNFAFRCYNEYDPYGIAPFGLQSSLTSIEQQSFNTYKKSVASALARHFVSFDVATLTSPAGGWNAFLVRLDSLLAWCQSSDIPVMNYADWKVALYDSVPDRVAETFPSLNADLDADQFPDGFEQTGIEGFFDPTDGVSSSGNKSFAIHGSGTVCKVLTLGGFEKGEGKFTMSAKVMGTDSSHVEVILSYPGFAFTDTLLFTAYRDVWTGGFQLTEAPLSASVMNVEIRYSDQDTIQDTLKVSGMSFRSAGFLRKTKLPDQVHKANEAFSNVNLNELVDPSIYPANSISWEITHFSSMNLTIQPGNILRVLKPASFWTGRDSCYAVGTAPDGIQDSCFMRFISNPMGDGCAGQPVTLTLLDTLSNDIIYWTSIPRDSAFTDTTIYNPTVAPLVPTIYKVRVINPLGPENSDSIFIDVYPFPQPDLPHDTVICSNDKLVLSAGNEGKFLWSTGDTTSSITVYPEYDTVFSVIVTSDHGCEAFDTTFVDVRQRQGSNLKYLLWPSYCTDGYPTTLNLLPEGGILDATSGLDSNVFYPNQADTGINYVWYTYLDVAGCIGSDTVKVTIVEVPDPLPLPDDTICADAYIYLDAGEGFDNYLWSTGDTLPTIQVDTSKAVIGYNEIRVYVTKDGCAGLDTAKITFINCHPGFGETENMGIRVFPNPATSWVRAEWLTREDWSVSLTEISGKVALTRSGYGEYFILDVRPYPRGFYLLTVKAGNRSATFGLVLR